MLHWALALAMKQAALIANKVNLDSREPPSTLGLSGSQKTRSSGSVLQLTNNCRGRFSIS